MNATLLRRRFLHAAFVPIALAAAACLVGFIRISFTATGPGFRWSTLPVKYVIQAKGSDDIADKSEEAAIRLAFKSWEQLTDSTVTFQEDTTADANRTDYTSADIHLVMWDETGSTGLFAPGSNVIALTPLLADTGTGQILDGDIVFNGKLKFHTGNGTGGFDVQSVATHEAGHLIGFDHAGGPRSTMFATITADSLYARSLTRDEQAAAATVYPGGGTGTIAGSVLIQGGAGIKFGQVVAVDRSTGELGGAAISDASGNYSISGLRPGTYDVYVEPINGPANLSDTIGYKSVTPDGFNTTSAPGNPINVSSGSTTALTFSAASSFTMNAAAVSGGRVIADGTEYGLLVTGSGLGGVTTAVVSGTGVTVKSLAAGATAVTLSLIAAPGTTPGTRCIELRSGGGEFVMVTAGVDIDSPDPTVTAVSPNSLVATGGENLTITGTNFTSGMSVVIGGQLATNVTFLATNQLRCTSPVSPGTTSAVDVVAIRTDGREGRLVNGVTYKTAPVPQSIDPPTGSTAGGTQHKIKGTGFASPAQVLVGDGAATVLYVTATEIGIVLPASPIPGKVDVRVEAGGNAGVLPGGFTYVAAAAPKITQISPTSGGSGTIVTLTGSDFASDAQVTFDGQAAQVQFVSASELKATAPTHADGAVEVRVRNPTTNLVGISPSLFSYGNTAAPVATSGGGGGGGGCALAPATDERDGGLGSALALLAVLGVFAARRRR